MTSLLYVSDGIISIVGAFLLPRMQTRARAYIYTTFRDLALFYIRLVLCHNTCRNLTAWFAMLIPMVHILCTPTSM